MELRERINEQGSLKICFMAIAAHVPSGKQGVDLHG